MPKRKRKQPAKKSATRRQSGRRAARTLSEARDLLESDFGRSEKRTPRKTIPELEQHLQRSPAAVASLRKSIAKATPGGIAASGPFAGLPAGVAAVLSARSRVPGSFNSDEETIAWLLDPNADLRGQTPLWAIFGMDSLPSAKAKPAAKDRHRR